MAAVKPVQPLAAGETKGAGKRVRLARDKLRTRERQSAFVAGAVAMRIEQSRPGALYCIKVTTTQFKTTTAIVFNRRRATDDGDDDDEWDGQGADDDAEVVQTSVPKSGPVHVPTNNSAPAQRQVHGGSKTTGDTPQQRMPQQQKQQPWQQQRQSSKKRTVQQQVVQVRTEPPTKVDRNAVSARGGQTLTDEQRTALANSVTSISKELCPPSTFTVRRTVALGEKLVTMDIIPTSPAAHLWRREPTRLAKQMLELFQRKDGIKLRELLAHDDAMQVDTSDSGGST